MEIKESKLLNEVIITEKLPSGAKCYIIPKNNYVEKQVIVTVKYGSVDNEFKLEGDAVKTSTPKGIAHYLEHKMFEEKNGNAFDVFSSLGSVVNAFTSANMTGYYFNCNDKFEENITELLGFVQRPYFTEENVEKEKGIIEQEIMMYDDNPNFKLYFNMLNAMYHNHGVKDNIAGTLESIKEINKELLDKCYNTFYTPNNMSIICVGKLEPKELLKKINSQIQPTNSSEIIRFYKQEPSNVKQHKIKEKMPVAMPMFMIGIKDSTCRMMNIPCAKILLDIIIGESSQLYQALYKNGLTNNCLGISYINGANYAHSIIAGNSNKPEIILEQLLEEIKRIKKDGIANEHFDRIKRKHIGQFIRGFNSISTIAMSQADLATKNMDLFSLYDSFNILTKKDVLDYLAEYYIEENITISIIY